MRSYKIFCTLLLIFGLMGMLGCDFSGKSSDDSAESASSSSGKTDDETDKSKISDEVKFESDEAKEAASEKSGAKGSTIVKFGKGKTSGTYENAVIRGESHTYILGAGKGQNMSVSISSTEDNAVFRVQTPGGQYLGDTSEEEGTKSFSETLPASGNYKITVSPERGNTTFKITFTVKGGGEDEAEEPQSSGGKTTVVRFRKGGTSATYENAVIRGDRDTYFLGASGGQQMSVSISSLEDNAVFDITAPNGRSLANESRNWSGQLPADGKYKIVVGGTRGNATYKISFSVR